MKKNIFLAVILLLVLTSCNPLENLMLKSMSPAHQTAVVAALTPYASPTFSPTRTPLPSRTPVDTPTVTATSTMTPTPTPIPEQGFQVLGINSYDVQLGGVWGNTWTKQHIFGALQNSGLMGYHIETVVLTLYQDGEIVQTLEVPAQTSDLAPGDVTMFDTNMDNPPDWNDVVVSIRGWGSNRQALANPDVDIQSSGTALETGNYQVSGQITNHEDQAVQVRVAILLFTDQKVLLGGIVRNISRETPSGGQHEFTITVPDVVQTPVDDYQLFIMVYPVTEK